MSIENCYTYSITATRQVWTNNTSSPNAIAGFKGHVQQAQMEFAEQLGEAWGKVYKVWCALGTDIKTGDTLTVSDGAHAGTYSVKSIQTLAMGDPDDHLEVICIKDIV